jgi:hypothetical protein
MIIAQMGAEQNHPMCLARGWQMQVSAVGKHTLTCCQDAAYLIWLKVEREFGELSSVKQRGRGSVDRVEHLRCAAITQEVDTG